MIYQLEIYLEGNMDKLAIPARTEEEFTILLEKMTSVPADFKERVMHDFLEKNPAMIPCLDGYSNHRHHGPVGSLIFTEHRLTAGHFNRVPDFLFVSSHSQANTFVFIEIEHPGKTIFNKDDQLSAHFNRAYQQLEDWRSWFNDHKNTLIQDLAKVNKSFDMDKEVDAEFILVIGRSEEYSNNQIRRMRIHQKNKAPLYVMSYDRLRYDHEPYCQRLAVVNQQSYGIEAVQFPKDYFYNYNQRNSHRHILNKENAIMENVYMSKKEKDDLIESIRKWDSLNDTKAREAFFQRSL
jgi:hypothetical protein